MATTPPVTATTGTARVATRPWYTRAWSGFWDYIWDHKRLVLIVILVLILGLLAYIYWPFGKPTTTVAAPAPTTTAEPPAKVVVTDSAQPSAVSDDYKNRLEQAEKKLAELEAAVKAEKAKVEPPASAKPTPQPTPKPKAEAEEAGDWNCIDCN